MGAPVKSGWGTKDVTPLGWTHAVLISAFSRNLIYYSYRALGTWVVTCDLCTLIYRVPKL